MFLDHNTVRDALWRHLDMDSRLYTDGAVAPIPFRIVGQAPVSGLVLDHHRPGLGLGLARLGGREDTQNTIGRLDEPGCGRRRLLFVFHLSVASFRCIRLVRSPFIHGILDIYSSGNRNRDSNVEVG